MSATTKIQWTDCTWRVVNADGETDSLLLGKPLHWRKPRRCLVSDLFHPDVPFDFIDRVFAVFALCPHITFQVLTKRPERMAEYMLMKREPGLSNEPLSATTAWYIWAACTEWEIPGKYQSPLMWSPPLAQTRHISGWPLPNVWLGMSCEDQKTLEERYEHLRHCPASVRFLSCEPMLAPIDLAPWLRHLSIGPKRGIHQVIVGGESGPHARPFNLAWARSIRDQCKAAGVAFFLKQCGARPVSTKYSIPQGLVYDHPLRDSHGGDPSEWPADLQNCREFPRCATSE